MGKLSGTRNGMSDAMRHCIWSCEMSRDIGGPLSAFYGSTHEFLGYLRGQDSAEYDMDTHNNACGRALAEKEKHTCADACLKAFDDGILKVLRSNPW